MIDRRQWPRYNLDLPIRVEGMDHSGSAFALTGRLRNISAKGALGNLSLMLQVGSQITLAIAFPFARTIWMSFECEVVRTVTSGSGVDTAVKFKGVRPQFSGKVQDTEDNDET